MHCPRAIRRAAQHIDCTEPHRSTGSANDVIVCVVGRGGAKPVLVNPQSTLPTRRDQIADFHWPALVAPSQVRSLSAVKD